MGFDSTRVRLLLVAWLVLVGAAITVGVSGEQTGLAESARSELAAAGIDATVSFSGRDATLGGAATVRAEAEAIVSGIDGVRVVDWVDTAASGATTTTAPAATTVPPTLPPISTSAEQPASVAHLEARLEQGRLVVRGAIPDAGAATRLAGLADLIYAPLVDNQLEVDDTLETASWVPRASGAIAVLPILGTSGLKIVGEEATLFGFAPTAERLAQLQGAVTQALGPDVRLTTNVEITGKKPPTIEATVPGDGILTISGTVPSRAIVDFAMKLGIAAYGADNVVNKLVVDPEVDTTFSLFRLPLVFGAFVPFPEWHVEIFDNVISGQLLSGATFPSGSHRLTPQLEKLMPIAAGILTRNPTLVITVEGHTDSIGSEESNQRLSEARAQSAIDWLIAAGLAPERLFAVGYGESRPIGDNSTPEGRAMNRRIEFKLGPPETGG